MVFHKAYVPYYKTYKKNQPKLLLEQYLQDFSTKYVTIWWGFNFGSTKVLKVKVTLQWKLKAKLLFDNSDNSDCYSDGTKLKEYTHFHWEMLYRCVNMPSYCLFQWSNFD